MEQQRVEKSLFLLATQILLLASLYFAGGKAGLNAPYVGSSITLFWPPSGIALAALLLWGLPCWPGIFLGALVTNLSTGDLTSHVALAIAIGNTAGPVLGALLLKKVMGFQNSFIRGRDVTTFLLIGPGSMLLTASIGVFALYAGGMLSLDVLSRAWVGWWLGDTVGVLVFTPFLLFLMNLRQTLVSPSQIKLEFIVVLGSCVCLTWLIFGGITAISQLMLPLAFLVFPPLIWAGLRLNALETFVVVLAIASIAVMGTAKGFGPFSGGDFQLDQLVLCVFVATITLIAFMMIGIQANQRQAEQQLQDSESRLRLALAGANQGLYDLNVQTGEAVVSPEYARMLGYDPRSVVETNTRWLERLHPADRDAVYQVYSDYIGGLREDYRVEFRQLTQQGEWKWILSLGKIVEWNPQGQPLRMLGTHTDISEQKRAEEEINQARNLLRTVIDATPDWIFVKDKQHRFLLVNQAFADGLGLKPEDLLGRPDTDFWPDYICYGDPARNIRGFHADDDEAFSGKRIRNPADQATLGNGQSRWFDTIKLPLRGSHGEVIGIVGFAHDITEQRSIESKYRTLIEQIPAVTYTAAMDPDVRTVFVSPQLESQLGFSVQEWLDNPQLWMRQIHADDRERIVSALSISLKDGAAYHAEYRIHKQDGGIAWVRDDAVWLKDEDGKPVLLQGVMLDITHQRKAEVELSTALEELKVSERHQRELRVLAEREQSRMGALLSAMNMGILFEDNEHRVEYVNPAFLRMWGIDEQENLLNKPARTILDSSGERFAQPGHASKHVLNALDTHEISERCELELNNGRTLTQLSYPVNDIEGRIIGRLWIYEDITLERQTAQQLLYLAERDPLTGLYNRHRFQEELNNLIATALRNRQKFALLYFDLDDFKYINDTFGHRAGDIVLVRTAGEISSIVRHIEVFARLGGDEFAILSHLQPDDDLSILPARIVTSISSIPLHFRDTNIRLTTSVGVAIFPEHGETAEDLVAHADAAMYQAKNQGKNTWAVYDPQRDSSEAMMHRLTWYNRIAQALEQNLFEVHFQGVYETAHNALTHLEILVRMRDVNEPAHLIMPGQFIPIAEKNGQIVTIDRWVIKRSIELLSENPDMPPVAINISGRTFDDPAIPQYIRNLLSELHVDPGRLIIELTETAAVSDIQDAQRFIEAVHQAGCCVCLDDFGSGFSTFGYLKYLGVEILKIDGLFIRDLPNNRDNQIFVKAMVEVARGLGKLTVAEFVEDAATLSMVKNLGVDLAQGYYFGHPSAQIPVKS